MKTLKDFNFKNKKVLVRCDFNVPLNEKGEIVDDFRIKESLPTINYLIKKQAKIILMSHLGENETLERVRECLEKYLNQPVKLIREKVEKIKKEELEKGDRKEIILLENLRINKGEKENNPDFSKKLALLGDIYINDAFSVCHRKHASIVGVPEILPAGAGFLLEKEVKILSKVLKNPWRPLVVIIGGVKIESKLKTIENLFKNCDHLLIGGKIAESILIVKGICIGRPWPSSEIVEKIEKLDLTSTKLHLPIDSLVSLDELGEFYVRQAGPAKIRKDELLLDIGPETIQIFSKIIKEAKMIIWAGPLGHFEVPKFERGTKEIGEQIVKNHKAFKIAGGGDTLSALSKFNLRDKFDHVSTGGGAMLEFLSGETLHGLKALEWK